MNEQMDGCFFFIGVGYVLSIQETYKAKFTLLTLSSRKAGCSGSESVCSKCGATGCVLQIFFLSKLNIITFSLQYPASKWTKEGNL